jgi:lantibiotic biosynthesis protein
VPAGDRRETAIALATEVAARVTEPHRLAAAIASANRQTNFPRTAGWDPCAIAQGDAGLAVMCAYFDACIPEQQWDVTGHRFLSAAAREAERVQIATAGLFGGLSGLAFAASLLSRDGDRYRRLLRNLESVLVPAAIALADRTVASADGLAVSEFDLISGLSGVGAYLLGRCELGEASGALRRVMGALVEIGGTREGMPRWRTPPYLMADETMMREFPTGNLNCGLAHGIPGPLALLALALRQGVEVDGQASAVRSMATWLVEHRVDDAWGVSWPSGVPVDSLNTAAVDRPSPRPTRSAWCYGSPGVARALWLAGEALAEPSLRTLAVDAMEAVYRRPLAERDIDSPTFCHGVAGLLQVTLRFAHDTGLPVFDAAARALLDQLLAAYRPESPLGYVSLEPGGNPVDRPGLLDGSAGVAMVLLAAASDVAPGWDRLFLLA